MRKLKIIIIITIIFTLFAWIVNSYLVIKTKPFIFRDSKLVPNVEVVLVPGASVYRSGDLSPILRQRVEAGIQYIFQNDSVKILFSGHVIQNGYNEPAAMAEFAKKRLISSSKILQDSNGTSTYATLLNCTQAFNFDSVLIVTQEYHLPRAIYIAQDLGLHAYGLIAPDNYFIRSKKNSLREYFSRLKDFLLLKFFSLFR